MSDLSAIHAMNKLSETSEQAQQECRPSHQLDDPEYVQKARKVACDYFEELREQVKTGKLPVWNYDLDNEIADGIAACALSRGRWLLHYDHKGAQTIHRVPDGVSLINLNDLKNLPNFVSETVSPAALIPLTTAILERLQRRYGQGVTDETVLGELVKTKSVINKLVNHSDFESAKENESVQRYLDLPAGRRAFLAEGIFQRLIARGGRIQSLMQILTEKLQAAEQELTPFDSTVLPLAKVVEDLLYEDDDIYLLRDCLHAIKLMGG